MNITVDRALNPSTMESRRCALVLIKAQFGKVCAAVIKLMFKTHDVTLAEIVQALMQDKTLNVTQQDARDAVMSLLQQNVIYLNTDEEVVPLDSDDSDSEVQNPRKKRRVNSGASVPGATASSEDTKDEPVLYNTSLDRLLPRARMALHCDYVGKTLGGDCEDMLTVLVVQGKRSRQFVVDQLLGQEQEEDSEEEPKTAADYQASFDTLIKKGYIELVFPSDSMTDPLSLWTAALKSLDAALLKKEISKYIHKQLGEEIGVISDVLLQEQQLEWKNESGLTSAILEEQLTATHPAMNRRRIETLLLQMKEMRPFGWAEVRAGEWLVHTDVIIKEMEERYTASLVTQHFGQLGSRVYALLLRFKCMEEKQLGNLGTAQKSQVRRMLYKMLQAGYLAIQEVSKTSDRAPNRTYYLWKVAPSVHTGVLKNLYFTIGNIKTRMEAELEKITPVVDDLYAELNKVESAVEMFSQWKQSADRFELALIRMLETGLVYEHQNRQRAKLFNDAF